MGTYLSTPVTDKCQESGESLECPDVPCRWGVVDMQGWRKSMEDAHVAITNIPMVSDKAHAKVFGVFDGHGGAEVARFAALYLVSVLTQQETWKADELPLTVPSSTVAAAAAPSSPTHTNAAMVTPVGLALRSTFHALDRMIDDPSNRGELTLLASQKPEAGAQHEAVTIPPTKGALLAAAATDETGGQSSSSDDVTKTAEDSTMMEESESSTAKESQQQQQVQPTLNTAALADNDSDDDDDNKDDDSNAVTGQEGAAKHDQDMMEEDDNKQEGDDDFMEVDPSNRSQVSSMFQKILSLAAPSGQLIVNSPSPNLSSPTSGPVTGPSTLRPSIMQNGRMICNLPEHSIHAGATAIVAAVTGRVLTVANAGDSRAVLCRAEGKTFALSEDHKPQQLRESTRIINAGGFVNNFGRVNGNLNLSRSVGDLKYKQVPGILPSEQMITAEPDIVQICLEKDDEFIILGCDGIWDCLTNEAAVAFVRQRINDKSPTEIGCEMLDQIISDDPRMTQGIGGDNMTIMIIDLQPASRTLGTAAEETKLPPAATTDGQGAAADSPVAPVE